MGYTEFVEEVKDKLQEAMGDEFEIAVHTAVKNNSTERTGVIIHTANTAIAPILYLEGFYDEVAGGTINVEEVVTDLIRAYAVNKPVEFDVSSFCEFDKISDKIIFKVVNKHLNRRFTEIPMESLVGSDLGIIFAVHAGLSHGSMGSITIKNEHLEMWGVDLTRIKELAFKNTPIIFPPVCMSMEELTAGLGIPSQADRFMWILSNEQKVNGASVIEYPGMLHTAAEKTGYEEYYILPSSIHEVLILPNEPTINPETLKAMVREINQTTVSPEEVLSDQVYLYSDDTRKIQVL